MPEIPKDIKSLIFIGGPKWASRAYAVNFWLGVACFVVGVIGDAAGKKLGLQPTSWFLIGIFFDVTAFLEWVKAYFGAKEG